MTQISKTSLWKDTCSDVYRGRGRPQDVAGATSTSPGRVKVYAVLLPHVLVSNTQSPTVLRLYKKSFLFFYRKHELILSSTGGKQTARGSESLIKN